MFVYFNEVFDYFDFCLRKYWLEMQLKARLAVLIISAKRLLADYPRGNFPITEAVLSLLGNKSNIGTIENNCIFI